MTPDERAVRFINGLRHTAGSRHAGKPFGLRDWQERIIRTIFGTLLPDGLRQYREVGIWLPRKNGKTQLAAAVALYMLFCEPEPEGQIYSAAADRAQASLVFNAAKSMLLTVPELIDRATIVDSQKRICNKRTGTFYAAISSEAGTKHGYNSSCVIADELHCWKKRDLWTALTTSFGARTQPLTICITTAGIYDKTSLEWELYDYACKVRDGVIIDPHYLPVIYGIDREADWLDETNWHIANPALGDFRSLDEMRILAKRASENPALENDFRRLYLNQHTSQTTRWLNMASWEACEVDRIDTKGEWFGGLDAASKEDVCAFVLAKRLSGGGYAIKPWFWIPEATAHRKEQDDRVPYSAWIKAGYLETTPGNRVDQRYITQRIKDITRQYDCRHIRVDPWNVESMIQELQEEDYEVVEHANTHRRMNEPCGELASCIADGTLEHDGNECMNWMASNVEVRHNSEGHIKPDKQATREKIDGITAAVMAIAGAMVAEDVYTGPGVWG